MLIFPSVFFFTSYPPAPLWDPEAFTILKRTCSLLYMLWVWPQGIFLVWRKQEETWSDAQTTFAGSFHCRLAVLCFQTWVTWLSLNKSGQSPPLCGVCQVKPNLNLSGLAKLIPHLSFWFHNHRDCSFWPTNTSLQIQPFTGMTKRKRPLFSISQLPSQYFLGFPSKQAQMTFWPLHRAAASAEKLLNTSHSGGSWEASHLAGTFYHRQLWKRTATSRSPELLLLLPRPQSHIAFIII